MGQLPVLLVVDDDPAIVRSLQVNLKADGFDVLTATRGREALDLIACQLPNLMIVDLLLPDMHGFDLCKKVKGYLDVPIIMLTAVGDEETIARGIQLYAEDYVVKPFAYRELLARIGRVLRRTQRLLPQGKELVVDKELRIDFARHIAYLGNKAVRLTPTQSRLLAALARNANHTVSFSNLIDEGWPNGEGDTSRLWVNIRRLRRKLEVDPSRPQRLITEQGTGYRLLASRQP